MHSISRLFTTWPHAFPSQRRSHQNLCGQVALTYDVCNFLVSIVRSTISMQTMLMLGGLGACPPGKF